MHLNKQFNLLAILALCLLFACQPETPSTEEAPPPEDQNMFGHYIPRGLQISSEGLAPGYLLHHVPNSGSFYLVDRAGLVVHEWKGPIESLGGYLMDDGSLTLSSYDLDFPVFGAGDGNTGRIQKLSWEGKLEWDLEFANEEHLHHHDLAVLPNGNILAIARELKTEEEVLQAGRKPELTPKAGLWPDKIVEIVPDGPRGGKVVWEWHIWDHLIQDYDATKDAYGDPATHPELLDVNLGHELPEPITQDSLDKLLIAGKINRNATVDNRGGDIYHVNAVAYNAELDQIIFSSPEINEIFIIDHSTTTEEAAGHTGGRWGRGGDFLWRWGNPQNYRHGDSTDQVLYYQHDTRWVDPGMPGEGHLTLFNNNIPNGPDSMSYSQVLELAPPVDAGGNYQRLEDGRFGPAQPYWQYMAPDTVSFYGSFISGAHRMQNGNTFITEGPRGRLFEVTPEKEIVWEYLVQHRGKVRKLNGDPRDPMPMVYSVFRGTFIPADHPGLAGRELVPMDPQPEVFELPPKPEEEEEEEAVN